MASGILDVSVPIELLIFFPSKNNRPCEHRPCVEHCTKCVTSILPFMDEEFEVPRV